MEYDTEANYEMKHQHADKAVCSSGMKALTRSYSHCNRHGVSTVHKTNNKKKEKKDEDVDKTPPSLQQRCEDVDKTPPSLQWQQQQANARYRIAHITC